MDPGDERKRTSDDASKGSQTTPEPGLHHCSGMSMEDTCLLAMRCPVYRRRDPDPGFRTELETLVGDGKGKGTSGGPTRPKVLMRRPGLDCSIVVMKRGNARGAKGAGHPRRDRQGQRATGGTQWSRRKAAAFRGWHEPDKSRGCAVQNGELNPCLRQEKLKEVLLGRQPYRMAKALWDHSMVEKHEASEHARLVVVQDPRDTVKAGLPEPQSPGMEIHIHRHGMYGRCYWNRTVSLSPSELFLQWTTASEVVQGDEQGTYVALGRSTRTDTGSPTGREAQGDGVVIVVRGRESRSHGEGPQVSDDQSIEVAAMARAENIRVIYSDLPEEWHWKAGRHRKSHIRFGEGVLEKYRRKRQLASSLLYFTYGSVRVAPCKRVEFSRLKWRPRQSLSQA